MLGGAGTPLELPEARDEIVLRAGFWGRVGDRESYPACLLCLCLHPAHVVGSAQQCALYSPSQAGPSLVQVGQVPTLRWSVERPL